MEILLWLVPPAAVTVLAMLYVAWAGRDHRGEIDRDEAVERLGKALDGRTRRSNRLPGYAVDRAPRERSTGVAVRRPAAATATASTAPSAPSAPPVPPVPPSTRSEPPREQRRAS